MLIAADISALGVRVNETTGLPSLSTTECKQERPEALSPTHTLTHTHGCHQTDVNVNALVSCFIYYYYFLFFLD